MSQAVHGAYEFAEAHPDIYAAWRKSSNTVAMLGARDEAHLRELMDMAECFYVPFAVFCEPDLGDAVTVLVIAPHPASKKITAGLSEIT